VVFFFGKTNEYETSKHINLVEIQKCRIINTPRTISNTNGNFKMVDKLEIAITCRDNSKAEIVLELYNAGHDGLTLAGELHLTEKWCKIVNDKLKGLSKKVL
jgi:hypothetical protein